MLIEYLFVFWFFLPAGIANVAPIVVAKLPGFERLDYPLDCNILWRGKRLLGSNKTWRGLVIGVLLAILTAWIQNYFWSINEYLKIDALGGIWNVLLLGFLLGFGALLGDAVKSFVKRRVNIPAGKSFYMFDQIDYVLGAAVMTFPFVPLSWSQELVAIIFWGLLSLLMSYIGYLSRFKKEPI